MKLRKPDPPLPPKPPGKPALKPLPVPSTGTHRRRWRVTLGVVIVLAIGVYVGWSLLRPDPLREAKEALDRRDFLTAHQLLSTRLTAHPEHADAQLLIAQTARRGGDSRSATEYLREYRERHGTSPAYELETRLLRAQGGDMGEADRLFAEYSSRADTPLVMEAYLVGKLRVLAPQGEGRLAPEAEDAALAAVAANEANLLRAVDLWLAARPSRADQVQGHLWRARVSFAANKHPDGLAALRAALALDPENMDARFQMALSVSLTDPEESLRHLELLRAAHPDHPAILLGLANTYRMLGRAPDARRLYEGLTSGPNRVDVLVELGALDLEEGRHGDAEKRLRAALEAAPNSPATNIAMSRFLGVSGRPDEAAMYRKKFEELEAEKKKPRPAPR